MKGFINTIRNIYKIEDLRKRILYTLGLLLIYRIGSFIVLPGIDPVRLDSSIASQTQSGILGLINIFAGGAFNRAAIFALGIMPYISASIIVQLLGITIPYFQKLQKEGESGRRKINQITRYLTVGITATQASGYVTYLNYQFASAIIMESASLFWFTSVTVLTAGTIFVMWIGEKITDKGIGNGISLLIMIGIIARLPFGLSAEFFSRLNEGGGLVPFLIEIAFLIGVVIVVILLVQGTRKIPVQYAKRIVGNKVYGGVRQYIPFKVNAAGVMPIIFAQALMFIPSLVAQFVPSSFESLQGLMGALMNPVSFTYNAVLAVLVILFTYFYTAILYNPVQMADEMKRNGAFIPGVKPGKKTSDYMDEVMSRITLPGSIFLAVVTILPTFASALGVNSEFAQFYGGTTVLILVGVVLDTLQQVESHLLMRHYDGLMKTGRIKGRSPVAASV